VIKVRAFAFGDVDAGIWGTAWLADSDDRALLALGDGSGTSVVANTLAGSEQAESWTARGEGGVELLLAPGGDAVRAPEQVYAFDQVCRVSGRFALGGRSHEVECLGWRGVHEEPSGRDRPESLRLAAAWFEPGAALALIALRPRGAKGQESDLVSAALLDGESGRVIHDPRLSTTYDRSGEPIRAGIELWLGEEDAEQYPYRAAGEAASSAATWSTDGLDLQACLFRWRSRGQDGSGVFLLGRRSER
jgi:hypothetical protein